MSTSKSGVTPVVPGTNVGTVRQRGVRSVYRTIEVNGAVIEIRPGMILSEYVIEGVLAVGGMATIYAAVHPIIGKKAAIKVMSASLSRNPAAVAAFRQEACDIVALQHPHIVDVFGFGTLPDGRSYFVMERLDGESLRSRLRKGPLTLGESCDILIQVADALRRRARAGHRSSRSQTRERSSAHQNERSRARKAIGFWDRQTYQRRGDWLDGGKRLRSRPRYPGICFAGTGARQSGGSKERRLLVRNYGVRDVGGPAAFGLRCTARYFVAPRSHAAAVATRDLSRHCAAAGVAPARAAAQRACAAAHVVRHTHLFARAARRAEEREHRAHPNRQRHSLEPADDSRCRLRRPHALISVTLTRHTTAASFRLRSSFLAYWHARGP